MASLREIATRHRALVAVTAVQAACAAYFLLDVASEFPDLRAHSLHPLLEVAVVGVLCVGTLLGVREIRGMLRRSDRMQGRLRLASGAFLDLIEESFADWQLTPSERDVALLALKGLPVSEIARLRTTREGTVKAQCAAVYRKARVNSRAELMSIFMEELMAGVVLDPRPAD